MLGWELIKTLFRSGAVRYSIQRPLRSFHFRLTTTIVEDPVIANTVHSNAISRYHAAVQRSGMGLGCRNDFQNCENDDGGDIASFVAGSTTSFIGLLFPFVDFIFPEDAKRRPVVFCVDPALLSILDVIGRRVWWKRCSTWLCWINLCREEDNTAVANLPRIVGILLLVIDIIIW